MLDGATYDQHDCRIQTTAQTRYYSTVLFLFKKITGSYSQNIIINAKANKYQQNHNQTILP